MMKNFPFVEVVIGCDDDRLPLAIEESEWDFPLVDDELFVH
jgi:hypothetical protein